MWPLPLGHFRSRTKFCQISRGCRAQSNMDNVDVLYDIFRHLDVKTLGHCAVVCKTWQEVTDTPLLWSYLCVRDYATVASSSDPKLEYQLLSSAICFDQDSIAPSVKMTQDKNATTLTVVEKTNSVGYQKSFGIHKYTSGIVNWDIEVVVNSGVNTMAGIATMQDTKGKVEHRSHESFYSMCLGTGLIWHTKEIQARHLGQTCGWPQQVKLATGDFCSIELDLREESLPKVTFYAIAHSRRQMAVTTFQLPPGKTWWPFFAQFSQQDELIIHPFNKRLREKYPICAKQSWDGSDFATLQLL